MTQQVKFRYYQNDLAKHYRKIIKSQAEKVNTALKSISEEMVDKLELTTRTWENKPKITSSPSFQGYSVEVEGDIFKMLDEGTKAHDIKPKTTGSVMTFKWPGQRKQYMGMTNPTRPPTYQTGEYGFYGSPASARRFKKVRHPGVKARRWTHYLRIKYRAEATRRVRAALKQGYEAVGL